MCLFHHFVGVWIEKNFGIFCGQAMNINLLWDRVYLFHSLWAHALGAHFQGVSFRRYFTNAWIFSTSFLLVFLWEDFFLSSTWVVLSYLCIHKILLLLSKKVARLELICPPHAF